MNKGLFSSACRMVLPSCLASSLSSGSWRLSFARADWCPAVMRPSTQSLLSSTLRHPRICSALKTSGICKSIRLEPETCAQHRHSSWSRHYVTTTNAIEIVLVRQVRNIEPEIRSEEHTSELQSQSNLVCRLLLEKKKQ